MKKITFLVFVVLVFALFFGCASASNITDEYYVAPVADDPLQGTWIQMGGSNQGVAQIGGNPHYLIVIVNDTYTQYLWNPGVYGVNRGWNRTDVRPLNDIKDQLSVSADGNILYVQDSLTYERVIR